MLCRLSYTFAFMGVAAFMSMASISGQIQPFAAPLLGMTALGHVDRPTAGMCC